MKTLLYILCFLTVNLLLACVRTTQADSKQTFVTKAPFRIAFGSCSKQTKSQRILDTVLMYRPDLFIYLGDNIYGDTRDMSVLEKKYQKLADKPEFKRLCKNTRVLATWDDHDYGENDAGKEYPFKVASKQIFLDFWNEPKDSERRKHPGIYHLENFSAFGKNIQVILLDTRTFRDQLIEKKDSVQYKNAYQPTSSPDSTFLGAAQWRWLEKQFKNKADIRIIASSNQFSHEYNGWESWTNVPHERQKMLDLIEQTKAEGVLFLSGDVHWGELSVEPATTTRYPIYDITSSGLTQNWDSTEENKNRIAHVVRKNNFGLREIYPGKKTKIIFKIVNKYNQTELHHEISLQDLKFKE